jgi:hypothetical protein
MTGTMTTESDNQVDATAIWRAIGRIEGDITSLKEGQGEIRADLREVNRRVDRLFYAILAVGGGLFVAIFASRLIGG